MEFASLHVYLAEKAKRIENFGLFFFCFMAVLFVCGCFVFCFVFFFVCVVVFFSGSLISSIPQDTLCHHLQVKMPDTVAVMRVMDVTD